VVYSKLCFGFGFLSGRAQRKHNNCHTVRSYRKWVCWDGNQTWRAHTMGWLKIGTLSNWEHVSVFFMNSTWFQFYFLHFVQQRLYLWVFDTFPLSHHGQGCVWYYGCPPSMLPYKLVHMYRPGSRRAKYDFVHSTDSPSPCHPDPRFRIQRRAGS